MTSDFVSVTEITRLLKAWGAGDNAALDCLIPKVHSELRSLAKRYMNREWQNLTLQPTALVNELYLRLVKVKDVDWQDRAHFFAIGSQLMRRVLVDLARARTSAKRGGVVGRLDRRDTPEPDCLPDLTLAHGRQVIAIDDALAVLEKMDPRKVKVIELRFFGGLSVEDTAAALHISPQTVMRDWKLAKAWLARELKRSDPAVHPAAATDPPEE